MKKRKTKVIVIGVLILILLAAYITRVVSLNIANPTPKVEQYQIGEKLTVNGYEYRVAKCDLVTWEQAYTEYKYSPDDVKEQIPDQDKRKLFVTLKVKRITDNGDGFSIDDIMPQSLTWNNGYDKEIYDFVNQSYEDITMDLDAGNEATIILPYSVFSSHFNEKQWKEIDTMPFQLVFSQDDVKKQVRIH